MRKYNYKISERANESLKKREAIVRAQKGIIAVVVIIIVSLALLLGTGIRALASSKEDPAAYNKYYKSVRVETGDTLWTIADEYIQNLNIDKMEYIEEICELNKMDGDYIQAGEYIVVAYYSKDVK